MEFQIIKLQGSIFTPELNVANSLSILNLISELLPEKLTGNPVVLPIPQDAPAGIPRLQFNSNDQQWRVTMSLERTDVIFQDSLLKENEKYNEKDFAEILADFFMKLKDGLNLSVQRLAFVTERVALVENSASFIISKFCKPEYQEKGNAFSNVKKFEIHSHKNYVWNDFNLNSWVRVKSRNLKLSHLTPAILIENDLNTLHLGEDPDKRFSSVEIEKFYKSVPKHLEGIIWKYFSEES